MAKQEEAVKKNTGFKHGTRVSYMRGCRCEECRWVEADRKNSLSQRYGSTKSGGY